MTTIFCDKFSGRKSLASPPDEAKSKYYAGVAIGGFDGNLQLMDLRGNVLRAKLITTVGGVELDCVLNKSQIPEVRSLFDRRVRVEGTVHYDGASQLPVRIDVSKVRPIKESPDLLRWKGAVARDVRDARDEDDW